MSSLSEREEKDVQRLSRRATETMQEKKRDLHVYVQVALSDSGTHAHTIQIFAYTDRIGMHGVDSQVCDCIEIRLDCRTGG